MRRVGVFSLYHNNLNCGGQLQAYALCKKISELGYCAEQVRHNFVHLKSNENKFEKIHRIFCNNFGIKKIQNRFKAKKEHEVIVSNDQRFVPNLLNEREDSYKGFVDKVPHSDIIYNVDTINDCCNEYDVFIVGSDQVWNPPQKNSVYLLDFLPSGVKKFSYAASISKTKLNAYEKASIATCLRSFSSISVREKEAVKQLSPLCSKKVECVLDPTLLLTAEQWDEVCLDRIVQEDYVFCYFLGNDEVERNVAAQYAKSKGVKLVTFIHSTNHYMSADTNFGDIQVRDISPERFLSLIKHADYVVTDSFHASVFSYIYKKEFFVFTRLGHKGMNSRLYTLLELINAQDHFCDTKEKASLGYVLALQQIDYNEKKEKLEKMRASSVEFLKCSLEK